MSAPPDRRITVILTGTGISPIARTGPLSTIQMPSATGFGISSGG